MVTFEMSKSGSPTLPWAIPCFHKMDSSLRTNIEEANLPIALRNAAAAGLNHLRGYYDKALGNHYNVIATGMHLRC